MASTTEKIASSQFLRFCEKYEQLFRRQNGLTNREFYVEINGERSVTIPLPDHGVVQGSGPGPLTFNLAYNDVFTEFEGEGYLVGFADDIALAVSSDNEETMKKVLEDGIIHIKEALKTKKIELHPKKTTLLRIGNWSEPIYYEGRELS